MVKQQLVKQVLIGAFEDTANDLDQILKWCYPMPGSGRFREANFTAMFVSHVTRRLNGGVFPIRSCESDAFSYFEAPVMLNADADRQDGRVDAIIANWKNSTFVAIESKGSHGAQRSEIGNQVQRLLENNNARHKLLHNFDWPENCNPLNFWLVVLSGYYGTHTDRVAPEIWQDHFKDMCGGNESHIDYIQMKQREELSFGLMFHCSLICIDQWRERVA